MTEQKPALRPTPLALAVGAALSLTGSAVLAADRAGRVLTTIGPVVARTEDGSTRSLSRGSRIYAGDVILTSRGRAQIRFRDGAMVSLQPNTRFQVERYETAEEDDDGGGSAIMRLFQGALRTITGAIGDDPDEEYRMETPVATVGIRGTQYALQYCEGNACGGDVPEGLYGHVLDEGVSVANAGGTGSFAGGSYFKVPDGNTAPSQILQPPGQLFRGDGAEGEGGEAGSTETGGGDGGTDSSGEGALTEASGTDTNTDTASAEYTVSSETSTEADETTSDTGDTAPSLSTLANAGVAGALVADDTSSSPFRSVGNCLSDTECQAAVDGDGNLREVGFGNVGGAIDATSSSLTLAESGGIGALGVTWGRWDGDFVFDSGSDQTTVTGSFPWAYTTNPTTSSELGSVFGGSGNLTFNQMSGPSPYGTVNGTDWSVDTLSVGMSYSGGIASINTNDVDLTLVGPRTISLSNLNDSATVDPGQGDRRFFVALEAFSGGDQGALGAVFTGDNGEALLVNFEALDYEYFGGPLQEVISGVKIIER